MANVELYIHPNWIPFYIECYNRMLFVEIIEGDVEEAKQILTDRYEDWVDGGPCEVCDVCCEEYMLEGLNNEKFIFSVGYGEEIFIITIIHFVKFLTKFTITIVSIC